MTAGVCSCTPRAAWMQLSRDTLAPTDSHEGRALGELCEQLGPQETLSILPGSWAAHPQNGTTACPPCGEGLPDGCIRGLKGPQPALLSAWGPSSPGCPHLFGFTEGAEGAGSQPCSAGAPLHLPGKPTALPQPSLRMASCSLPRLQQQKERPLPPSGNSHPQPNQAVCREEGGEERGAAVQTGGSTREWTDGRRDGARVSICE